MLTACICEYFDSPWARVWASQLRVMLDKLANWICSVSEERLQRPFVHLLEAKGEYTISCTACDRSGCHVHTSASSRTIVVDIEDGDACVADSVDGTLSRARVPVDIGSIRLL